MIYVYILSESWALKASLSHACKLFSTATRVGFFNTNKYSEDSQRRALSGQEVNKHWRAHTSLHTFRCERGLELTLPRNGWEGNHRHCATARGRELHCMWASRRAAGPWPSCSLAGGAGGRRAWAQGCGEAAAQCPAPTTPSTLVSHPTMVGRGGGSGNHGCAFLQWWIKTMSNRAWAMAQAGCHMQIALK